MKTFGEERMSTEKLITEKVLTLKGNVKIKYVLTQEVKKKHGLKLLKIAPKASTMAMLINLLRGSNGLKINLSLE